MDHATATPLHLHAIRAGLQSLTDTLPTLLLRSHRRPRLHIAAQSLATTSAALAAATQRVLQTFAHAAVRVVDQHAVALQLLREQYPRIAETHLAASLPRLRRLAAVARSIADAFEHAALQTLRVAALVDAEPCPDCATPASIVAHSPLCVVRESRSPSRVLPATTADPDVHVDAYVDADGDGDGDGDQVISPVADPEVLPTPRPRCHCAGDAGQRRLRMLIRQCERELRIVASAVRSADALWRAAADAERAAGVRLLAVAASLNVDDRDTLVESTAFRADWRRAVAWWGAVHRVMDAALQDVRDVRRRNQRVLVGDEDMHEHEHELERDHDLTSAHHLSSPWHCLGMTFSEVSEEDDAKTACVRMSGESGFAVTSFAADDVVCDRKDETEVFDPDIEDELDEEIDEEVRWQIETVRII